MIYVLKLSAIIAFISLFAFAKDSFDADDVCGHLGACRIYEEHGVPRCHCDNLCAFYGDCCFGFSRNDSDSMSHRLLLEHEQVSKDIRCENVRGNLYKFWLVNVESACRITRSFAVIRDTIFNSIPVHDTLSQLTYRNIYCSRTEDISSVRFWKVKVSGCLGKILGYVQNVVGGKAGLYEVYEQIFNDPACIVAVIPPKNSNPRICFTSDSECVDTNLHNSCFAFQNPVIQIPSKTLPTTTSFKLYRNYICRKCDANQNSSDKLVCRLENHSKAEMSVILTDIAYEVLAKTFILPALCSINGVVETQGACKILNCPEGLVQNYFECVYPVKYVSGIQLDLRIRLLNQSGYNGSLPLNVIKDILDTGLKQNFKDFSTQISVSARRGSFGKLKLPCMIYMLDLHILLKEYLDYKRSIRIKDEVKSVIQNQSTTFERLLNLTSMSYSHGDEYDEECTYVLTPAASEISYPKICKMLLIFCSFCVFINI